MKKDFGINDFEVPRQATNYGAMVDLYYGELGDCSNDRQIF